MKIKHVNYSLFTGYMELKSNTGYRATSYWLPVGTQVPFSANHVVFRLHTHRISREMELNVVRRTSLVSIYSLATFNSAPCKS